jgi:hypothetical protein
MGHPQIREGDLRSPRLSVMFIQNHLGYYVARGGSHILSRNPDRVCTGIEQIAVEFCEKFGVDSLQEFLFCIEHWLTERHATITADAVRAYAGAPHSAARAGISVKRK